MRIEARAPANLHPQQITDEIRAATGVKPRLHWGGAMVDRMWLDFPRELTAAERTSVEVLIAVHDGSTRTTAEGRAQQDRRDRHVRTKEAMRAKRLRGERLDDEEVRAALDVLLGV